MTDIVQPLGTRAYQLLWNRIVHLEYPPLTPLQDKQLSAELGLGLAPIRQALRRLEYDGLVMILPRRGTLTSEIGLHTVRWELEVREELEGLAAQLAAQRGPAEQHAELHEIVEQLTAAAHGSDRLENHMAFTDLDSAFHRSIHRQAHNPRLLLDLERHFSHALRLWHFCHRHAEPGFSFGDYDTASYRAIAAAISDRDAEGARAAMRRHVRRDTESALALLKGLSA